MDAYVPRDWPTQVHPPGSERFEETAVRWLFELVPADYRAYGVLRRYPIVLARMAVHHVDAEVAAARQGFRTSRTDLADAIPPHAVEVVLDTYRREGTRLVELARAVRLVESALRGQRFTPKL